MFQIVYRYISIYFIQKVSNIVEYFFRMTFYRYILRYDAIVDNIFPDRMDLFPTKLNTCYQCGTIAKNFKRDSSFPVVTFSRMSQLHKKPVLGCVFSYISWFQPATLKGTYLQLVKRKIYCIHLPVLIWGIFGKA